MLVLVFFALGRLTAWLRVWPWLVRWRSVFEAMGAFGWRDLAVLVGLALLRFAVVCFQLQLFWLAFDLPLAGAEAWARSIELFALQASLPGFVWTDLGVRGSVALWLLADYSADAWRLVGPSFALWLLNVIVPALLGWVSLWFVKWRDVVR